jgi:hypothetical protein
MNKWLKRWERVSLEFAALKAMTKGLPAAEWSPHYRALAEKIHTMGREHFHTGFVAESLDEKERHKKDGSPLEAVYREMTKFQAKFPHCPFCGRKFPGHCHDHCITVLTWAEIRREKDEKEEENFLDQ